MSGEAGNKGPRIAIALLAALALAGGVWLGASRDGMNSGALDVGPAATVLPAPRALPPFTLTRTDGTVFNNASLRGKWSFMFFGYTYCPDVCPIALSTFREVKALMTKSGDLANVQFVFVSVDPERDTLKRLGAYVTYFDPDFLGATGSQDQLLTLTRPMGVVYQKVDGDTPDDYLVDHSAGVFLVGPDGTFRAYFPAPQKAPDVVAAFDKIAHR